MTWQNRIVGAGEEAPDQLLAHPANWRIHPQAQQEALKTILDTVGYVVPVLVNQRTGHVVDGHLRVALAISKGQPTIPVNYVDLTPEEEALVLATLDPLGSMAATDREQLSVLVTSLELEDAGLKELLGRLTAPPKTKTVEFAVPQDDAPTCPTCGQKVKPVLTTHG